MTHRSLKAKGDTRDSRTSAFIEANRTDEAQSERAKLYDLLADLTDEDGALSGLDDLGEW